MKPTKEFKEQYPLGEKFLVVDEVGPHFFKLGEIVELIKYRPDYDSFVGLRCVNSNGLCQTMEAHELKRI
jgi:hypothetical protein